MKYTLLSTEEFDDWLLQESARSIVQIDDRLDKIQEDAHFGDHKHLRGEIWELKWKNGRRIYYAIIPVSQILLLLGGNKNGQNKDINQAEKIYRKWICD